MNFTLNILGTASALPIVNRHPSAQVLDVRGRLFLIDCGEGAQIMMRRMHLSFLKLDRIFISHLHGDHCFGIFGLLSTMGMLGRTASIHIYAPEKFSSILKSFMEHFGDGLRFGIEHHPLVMDGPQTVFSSKSLEISAFPLNHRIETFGFLFREKTPAPNIRKDALEKYGLTLAEIGALKRGEDITRDGVTIPNGELTYIPYVPRSYAYCSDTAPFPELARWVEGVDLLYHEATFPEEMTELAAATAHSTTVQAAQCASAARVGKLLIGHYSSRFPDAAFFLDEAKKIFPNTELTEDGMKIDLPLCHGER